MVHVLALQIAAREVEEISDRLWAIPGLLGIQECPLDAGAAGFFEVKEGFEFLEFGSEAAEKCAEWLESDSYRGAGDLILRVHAESDELSEPDRARATLAAALDPHRFELLSLQPVQDKDYLEEYRKNVRGHAFGGPCENSLWIGPPWDTPPNEVDSSGVFYVEPGLAFGTGDHPTTQMCLESLWRLRESGACPRSLLDLGTGSGVLAAAAARFFPDCSVMATDLDPLCDRELAATLELNGIPRSRVRGVFGSSGAVDRLVARGHIADVVVSNIYAEVLVKLLPDIRRVLVPGGLWIASGILNPEGFEAVRTRAVQVGLVLDRQESRQLERPSLAPREGLVRVVDTWFGVEFRVKTGP